MCRLLKTTVHKVEKRSFLQPRDCTYMRHEPMRESAGSLKNFSTSSYGEGARSPSCPNQQHCKESVQLPRHALRLRQARP